VIWDADFLYGPRTAVGQDTYVLCEINVSAVWPFPPMAALTIAASAFARVQEARKLRLRPRRRRGLEGAADRASPGDPAARQPVCAPARHLRKAKLA
jgi:hypothetical protein